VAVINVIQRRTTRSLILMVKMFSINFVMFAFFQTFILSWQPWKCRRHWHIL